MRDDLMDKDRTLGLATQVGTTANRAGGWRAWMDPRVWLGAFALNRSVAAEKKTLRGTRTPKDRKSYLPRDIALSLLQARTRRGPSQDPRSPKDSALCAGSTIIGSPSSSPS